ncbi:hypothetical protein GCM10010505_69830 [Kitasatospora aburaviensis]
MKYACGFGSSASACGRYVCQYLHAVRPYSFTLVLQVDQRLLGGSLHRKCDSRRGCPVVLSAPPDRLVQGGAALEEPQPVAEVR